MKKIYEDPEFEVIQIKLSDTILNPSTFVPEETIGEDIVDDDP